jgi:23S rRNA (guanosine2251-2'-O)-methyltransferase
MGNRQTEILYGFHPVREALRAGRRQIVRICTTRSKTTGRIKTLLARAAQARVPMQTLSPAQMATLAQTEEHQGVCAEAGFYPVVGLQEIVDRIARGPAGGRLLLLDNIVDPHNLGALIRTASCAAMDGIVTTKDRSASPTPAVSKTSAGALEHIRLARVTNMANTIKNLQSQGMWVIGLDGGAKRSLYDVDLTGPLALAIGSEAKGLRPLVKKTCDQLVCIPQNKTIDSLNASVAGGIAIYETYRQQLAQAGSSARPLARGRQTSKG